MGQYLPKLKCSNPVNYDCPVCKNSGKLPNIAGKFFIINSTECKCNGCNTVFEKSKFYKQVIFDASLVETKDASSVETKDASSVETKDASSVETKDASSVESNIN